MTSATEGPGKTQPDADEHRPGPAPAGRLARHGPVIALVCELIVATVFFVRQARRLWFFADDWEFLLNRRLSNDTLDTLFRPHNEHWSTVPILVFRTLFTSFGVRHYLPYALVVIAAHIGVCVLLWLLLRRAGITAWISVGIVGVMAFLGAGSENILWDFQIGFTGSVLFGLLALLAADREGPFARRDGWAWAAALAGLMSSGIGLVMLGTLGLFVWLRRGWRPALAVTGVPAGVYLIWYALIGHEVIAQEGTPGGKYLLVPRFIWTGLTNVWQQITGIPSSGALFLGALVVPLLFSRGRDRAANLAIAGAAGAVGLFVLTGLTRVRFGVAQANAWRYVYVAAVLLLPALAWAAQQVYQRARQRRTLAGCAFAFVIVLLIVNGLQSAVIFTSFRRAIFAGREERIIAAAALARSGEPVLSQEPDHARDPDITMAKLGRRDIRAAFGDVHPTPQGLLDARAAVQVGVSDTMFPAVPPAQGASWNGVEGRLPTSGCTTGRITSSAPAILIPSGPQGGQLRLIIAAESLTTSLISGGQVSARITWETTPGLATYVASIAPNAQLRIYLPKSGKVTVCVEA
ncbi:MAG: hypothetical protein ABR604_01430 [Jatrophihabitantaceae bacterium]